MFLDDWYRRRYTNRVPPPANTVKIVLSGAMPGGDRWSSGFWMRDTGANTESLLNALCNIIYGTITDSSDSGVMTIIADNYWSNLTNLDIVQGYHYAGGSSKSDVVGAFTPPVPLSGAATAHMPNQVALVTTLQTGLEGRRNRGRMYVPFSGASIQPTGQLSVAQATQVNTAWSLFFSDINGSDTGAIVVVSVTGSVAHDVTAVKTDTRLDIQRRRAEQQAITGVARAAVTPHGS